MPLPAPQLVCQTFDILSTFASDDAQADKPRTAQARTTNRTVFIIAPMLFLKSPKEWTGFDQRSH